MKSNVLIYGDGACAHAIAGRLSHRQVSVCLAMTGGAGGQDLPAPLVGDRPQVIHHTRLAQVRGTAGDFRVRLAAAGAMRELSAAALVISQSAQQQPTFSAYGLVPGPRVVRLSEADQEGRLAPNAGDTVLLLNSWETESHPAVVDGLLRLSEGLIRNKGVRLFYLTGNLKVAATGLEARCEALKAAGAVFVKLTGQQPSIVRLEDSRIRVDCTDELLNLPLTIIADWVVVDETVVPNGESDHLAPLLGLERDAGGFLQSGNVHRLPHHTNRQGIFVAGLSRGIILEADIETEAGSTARAVLDFLNTPLQADAAAAQINQGRCARCLTCYRLCPYGAVSISDFEEGPRVSVAAAACQGCGICVAACPAVAIELTGVNGREIAAQLAKPLPVKTQEPFIAAFCCARSAEAAHQLARTMGWGLPTALRVIAVPCGGSVAVAHLMAALEQGAEGVLVGTCHDGNCHSESGNRRARQRIAQAQQLLTAAGIDRRRLCQVSLAANQGRRFAEALTAFQSELRSLKA